MITQDSSCCHWAVLITLSMLVWQCQSKAFCSCKVDAQTMETGKERFGAHQPNNIMDPDCLNYSGGGICVAQIAVRKKRDSSLIGDFLQYMNPDSPREVVKERENQFRNLRLEDVSDQEIRKMLEFMGFSEMRYPEPEHYYQQQHSPGWYFKKMALKNGNP